jgi:hypothetical protein
VSGRPNFEPQSLVEADFYVLNPSGKYGAWKGPVVHHPDCTHFNVETVPRAREAGIDCLSREAVVALVRVNGVCLCWDCLGRVARVTSKSRRRERGRDTTLAQRGL